MNTVELQMDLTLIVIKFKTCNAIVMWIIGI
jgi:hypothetical protein